MLRGLIAACRRWHRRIRVAGILGARRASTRVRPSVGATPHWNNQSAPGFMHGDGNLYGSIHRVELFDQWPDKSELKDVVGIMNRSATEDTLSPVWPVISEVLRSTDAPSSAAAEVVDLLDAWVADDAPLLDADEDGFYDRAGALLMDRLWAPIADAVMEPVFGGTQPNTINFRGIGSASLGRQRLAHSSWSSGRRGRSASGTAEAAILKSAVTRCGPRSRGWSPKSQQNEATIRACGCVRVFAQVSRRT